jgi:3-hydroxyisobutyrate dehydrogenase/glyoxylate/succinic semialdehyde reductase
MIGFIGLGIMGSRMAKNLLNNGFELIVHNRTKEKAEDLINNGARWAESPREVAQNADIIFTMLSNPQVVENTALGEDGFLPSFAEGKLWVDCSTVDSAFTKKMAAESLNRRVRFLEAPVTGSRIPAERAELVFLVGGKKEDLEQIRPMLEVMGKQISYQGDTGKGAAMKLVINLMLGQTMAVFAEAVSLGESIGLEKEMVVNTLLNGPTTAPFLSGKKQKVMDRDFSVDFPLEHLQKDLFLVSKMAFEHNLSMPIANVTKEIYGLAKQEGMGKQDFSAIYQLLSKE